MECDCRRVIWVILGVVTFTVLTIYEVHAGNNLSWRASQKKMSDSGIISVEAAGNFVYCGYVTTYFDLYHITSGLPGLKNPGWSEKVLLSDVKTLTLKRGKMTAGRRSSPVPQLKCVGGTARGQYEPDVVQCYNRGSDGNDAQWECKSDMDVEYKFGNIQVSCEGYDYPDDPYVLKGSCGLEYTLDLTGKGNNYKYSQSKDSGYHYYQDHPSSHKKSKWGMTDIITLGVVAGVIYVLYRTCIKDRHPSSTDMPSPGMPGGTDPSAPPPPYEEHPPPPPYGFKPETTQGAQPPPYSSSSYGFRSEYTGTGSQTNCRQGAGSNPTTGATGTGTGGGFWTGMAAGGVLGYLFGGSSNNYGSNYNRRHRSSSGFTHDEPYQGSSWFGSSPGGFSRSSSSSGFGSDRRRSSGFSSSSGTHTSSGFGGTSRR